MNSEAYRHRGEFNEHGRRTELIRGILIEKMSKSPLHSAIAKRLYDLIARVLPSGFVVRREDPITLADSEPEPDIAVVTGHETVFFRAHPSTAELVVEVAVSHPALDRENASLYAEAGVKEYWIGSSPHRCIQKIHLAPPDGFKEPPADEPSGSRLATSACRAGRDGDRKCETCGLGGVALSVARPVGSVG